ncbi:MAG: DUF4389 domain-containing protein [Ilumatobacteraceae bacterium]
MSSLTYDVTYPETRNRLTVAFRIILAIPHLIVSQVWGYLAQVLALIQWVIVLFTGKRNEGMWNLQQSWLMYYGRVNGYTSLLYDEYPAFGTDPGSVPVRSAISFEESANRLTNALRIVWMIPALIIAMFIGIASAVLLLISWLTILFTGTQPRGMWDFLRKSARYTLQLQAYGLLMTDDYPKFGEGAMETGYAGSPSPGSSYVPPPPVPT